MSLDVLVAEGKIATITINTGLRRMVSIGLVFVAVMVPTTVWLAHRPPTTNCNDRSWLSSNDYVLATKVVVEPWYGRHNVYGVFVIPDQFRDKDYSTAVVVRGVTEHTDLSPVPTREHGIIIAGVPDRYVKHSHIHSRIALWFLLTGHFGDIQSKCNWALVFTAKSLETK